MRKQYFDRKTHGIIARPECQLIEGVFRFNSLTGKAIHQFSDEGKNKHIKGWRYLREGESLFAPDTRDKHWPRFKKFKRTRRSYPGIKPTEIAEHTRLLIEQEINEFLKSKKAV